MEMDGFHTLPPAKRFMHLQLSFPPSPPLPKPSPLPAKKRADPRKESAFTTSASYCLPAKKRVWAPHPPFSPLDAPSEDEPESHPPKKQPRPRPTLPDLNEVEDPQEDDPILEKAEEATGAVEVEEGGIVCCICSSTDGDPSHPIVFCDGCDLTVHATCYGSELSRAATGSAARVICPRKMERRAWARIASCVQPKEVRRSRPSTADGTYSLLSSCPGGILQGRGGREGIDFILAPCQRWEGVCYICSTTNGCVIDCSQPECSLVFHVGCGLKEDLCMEYREGRGGAVVAGFCKVHTLLRRKQQQKGKFKIVPGEHKRKKM